MEIIADARTVETFDYPTAYLQTGDFTIKGRERWCGIKVMSLNDFAENMSGERFFWELERLSKMKFGAVLIKNSTWQNICDRHYEAQSTPAAVIGRMLALSIQYGIPIGPISDIQGVIESALTDYYNKTDPVIKFRHPPILPHSCDDPHRHSLTGLNEILMLEKFTPVTSEMFRANRINVENYIENRVAETPFYGVLFLQDRELNTGRFEAQLKGISQSLHFPLVVSDNRDQGINEGLKNLWKRLLTRLNMN